MKRGQVFGVPKKGWQKGQAMVPRKNRNICWWRELCQYPKMKVDTRWWFQSLLIFTSILGEDSHLKVISFLASSWQFPNHLLRVGCTKTTKQTWMVVVSIICSFHPEPYKQIPFLGGGFKYFFIFTPNFADDFQFDEHIPIWLKAKISMAKKTHQQGECKKKPTWRVLPSDTL